MFGRIDLETFKKKQTSEEINVIWPIPEGKKGNS